MPDTLNNINLPAGVPVDLYAESGIAVGARIRCQNLSSVNVRLFTGALPPDKDSGSVLLEGGSSAVNAAGDAGAWATAVGGGGMVNVGVA